MNVLIATLAVLVAAGGTAVVLTRDPKPQAVTLSMFGLLLTLLFLVVEAADVALSELVINALIVPLMILLAIAKVRSHE
jgi:energy-converting hydrogenase B subunit D